MLIGISNAFVVLLFKLVFIGVRIGIAPAPELLDKTLALVIGCQFLKGFSLLIGNDISDVLLKPVLVSLLEFGLHIAGLVHRILTFLRFVLREPKQAGSCEYERENGQPKRGILAIHN